MFLEISQGNFVKFRFDVCIIYFSCFRQAISYSVGIFSDYLERDQDKFHLRMVGIRDSYGLSCLILSGVPIRFSTYNCFDIRVMYRMSNKLTCQS